jgi:hypothetical protein
VFSVVRAAAVATQRSGNHISTATTPDTIIYELCFLRGPCREVMNETRFRVLLIESQSVKRRLGGWCEMAASLGVR